MVNCCINYKLSICRVKQIDNSEIIFNTLKLIVDNNLENSIKLLIT